MELCYYEGVAYTYPIPYALLRLPYTYIQRVMQQIEPHQCLGESISSPAPIMKTATQGQSSQVPPRHTSPRSRYCHVDYGIQYISTATCQRVAVTGRSKTIMARQESRSPRQPNRRRSHRVRRNSTALITTTHYASAKRKRSRASQITWTDLSMPSSTSWVSALLSVLTRASTRSRPCSQFCSTTSTTNMGWALGS
jgi:hypothetical protein